jgi:tetratricopeptide (TPR) repeat protein
MLQTVREYAYEQLERRGEVDEFERQHAEYFVALAEQAEPDIRGPEQALWLDRLSEENDNLRAALGWSSERGEIELGLRLATALGGELGYWHRAGHLSEGQKRISELVDRSEDVPPLLRARGLFTIAELAYAAGDFPGAEPVCERGLALFRELDDRKGVALSLAILGILATRSHGDHQRARRLGEESVALARELGDERVLARALNELALTLDEGGHPIEAVAVHDECLALRRKSHDQYAIAESLINIGCGVGVRGDYARARSMFEEALTLPSSGDRTLRAYALGNLGWVELLDGDFLRATSALSESITIFTELGERRMLAENLFGFAGVAAAQGQAIRAGQLWGAAEAALDGAPLSSIERAIEERYVRAARAELSEAEWAKESAAGRALTREQAVDYALEPVPAAAESR